MKHAIFLLLSALAPAQQLTWRELPAGSAPPTGRVDGVIAYDERERRIYMFGGRDSRPQNDLWSYSIDAGQWTQLRPSGSPPAARFGHTLLFDAERRRLLLFGGQASGFFSDTWAYDIARNTWQQIAPGGSGPNERYGHSAILDAARGRMIISHGFTDDGRFDDTWALDLATNRWRDISPSNGRPLRRCLHHAVLDTEGNQMLPYGGCASGFGPCPLGDLWSFDLTTHRWTERTGGIKPPERQWYGKGFDTARRRLILFGGSGASGNLNDTWEYDPARQAWVQMRFTPAPAPRSRHEAVFAPGLGVVFFGGSADQGLSNQLLAIGANAVSTPPRFSSAAVVNAFNGTPGPLSPGAIISIYGENLGPAFGTSAAVDAQGNLPKSIAGAAATINGIRAPLFYAQSGQVNLQVPYELAGANEAELRIEANGRLSEPVTLPVANHSPGIHPSALRLGNIIVIFATGVGAFSPAVPTGTLTSSDNPPAPVAPIELTLAGVPAAIEFAGHAPQTAGVLQINARLPEGVTIPEGRIEATLRIAGIETTVTLTPLPPM
ncbi:MAG: hypothetical protein JNL62_10305 [Bryobacterales bacterium]|nr:hypothetical protein [Bryobacterales bacterium]